MGDTRQIGTSGGGRRGGGELDICANTHTHKMARWGSREGRVKDSLRAGCSCEVQSPSVHTHNLLHVPRAGPRR